MTEILKALKQDLGEKGFKSSIVSTQHLIDLKESWERTLNQETSRKESYDEIISRYGLRWQFTPPKALSDVQTIIITAIQQPKLSVRFTVGGKPFTVIIPPTYIHDTDKIAFDIISTHVGKHGYKVCNALLPSKLLSVHSGLARYGRNNISYIEGWGSYYRLRAFFSDAPCTEDSWQEMKKMDICETCVACAKSCPSGAISKERFVVRFEKCLTYFNEGEDVFPKWLDPSWHNCVIGCMLCQDVCPANSEYWKWIEKGEEFSEEETRMILDKIPEEKLPKETLEKLTRLYLIYGYDILPRNLGILVEKREL